MRVDLAEPGDLEDIRRIYNEGIADRVATLDEDAKSSADIAEWWMNHNERYAVLVARDERTDVVGWASLNPYSHRYAYRGVADISIYVARNARNTGVGSLLLAALEKRAAQSGFHKLVLFALSSNVAGHALYRKFDYREVGVFREQGRLDGVLIDVLAMEKILAPGP